MTKYARTFTGSIYEIDEDAKKIRRLSGVKDSTPRQGADGDWKQYQEIMMTPLKNMVIIWETTINPDGELINRATATSPVEAFGDTLDAIATIN